MGFSRTKLSLLTALLLGGLVILPATPAAAERFTPLSTDGDGWDITFHPTNQDYVFFAHHAGGSKMSCIYRIDPDGDGPLNQGDGCFSDGAEYQIDTYNNGQVGQTPSVHITSDGNTAYLPLVRDDAYTGMGRFDISDPDPDNWTALESTTFPGVQKASNSIMVDDLIYMVSQTSWMIYDTATDTYSSVAFGDNSTTWFNSKIYHADNKLWTFTQDWHGHCFDLSTSALCTNWTNGKSTDPAVDVGAFNRGDEKFGATVEYRNTDGSFNGFCLLFQAELQGDGTRPEWTGCLNAAGQSDTTMVNPWDEFLTLYDAGGDHTILDVAGTFAVYEVTRQHQTILHETWLLDRQNTDYLCWDYTTQAACDNFITQGDNASAGDVYAVRQDPWIDTCFWSNSHDKVVGVWETTEGSALGTDLCDVIYSTPPTTTTVPPTEESTTTAPDPLVELPSTGTNDTSGFFALAMASSMLGAVVALTAAARRRSRTV